MKVELISHYGSDEVVANVARVSFNKKADNYTVEQNSKLINYLAKHKHTSPFRHCNIQFRIECPIYVERQLFTHQIGWARNSISGRYVDFSDTYTIIQKGNWRGNPDNIKQGSSGSILHQSEADFIQDKIIEHSKLAYKELIELGVCKEQARTILPLCLNTQFIWTGSLHAIWHLCDLRLKPTAQEETRNIVSEMLNLIKEIPGNPFEHSLKAFGY